MESSGLEFFELFVGVKSVFCGRKGSASATRQKGRPLLHRINAARFWRDDADAARQKATAPEHVIEQLTIESFVAEERDWIPWKGHGGKLQVNLELLMPSPEWDQPNIV